MIDTAAACNEIRKTINDLQSWTAKLPFETDDGKMVDLVPFLKRNPFDEDIKRNQHKHPRGSRFRFPSRYNGWDKKGLLERDLSRSSLNNGGQRLIVRSSRPPGSILSTESQRIAEVHFSCERCKVYEPNPKTSRTFEDGKVGANGIKKTGTHQKRKGKRKKKGTKPRGVTKHRPKHYCAITKRPLNCNSKCPFTLTVFLCADQCWCLAVAIRKKNPCEHSGHAAIDASLTNPGLDCLPESEIELMKHMEQSGSSHADIARTVSQRTDNLWTPDQLRYLSDKINRLSSDLSPDASSADRLVQCFQER
jgi:hypothetical protein